MVARLVRDEEAAGSNPVSPTEWYPTGKPSHERAGAFHAPRGRECASSSAENGILERIFYQEQAQHEPTVLTLILTVLYGLAYKELRMRFSTRILLASLISVLGLAAVPAPSQAAQARPMVVVCCR